MEKKLKLLGNRFLTLNTIVRVNQIEPGRGLSLGNDEVEKHHPEYVQKFRQTIAEAWPEGRITWGFSWQALHSEHPYYLEIKKLMKNYHETYGDEITINPGSFFANAYNTREQVNQDMHEMLLKIREFMGEDYNPKSVIAGFLAAENQRFLAEEKGIHVCQGNIWSQFSVDNQDGEGSICYPYYPSKEHFCKPAQGEDDFIDSVCLDGWTMDFLAARRAGRADGFNSRMGVGPIETLCFGLDTGIEQMIKTTSTYFDTGFEMNEFAWVTNCWEISQFRLDQQHAEALTIYLKNVKEKWPNTKFVTIGEFGLLWREHFKNNDSVDYKFTQKGTGIGGSDKNLEIKWYMNKDFRMALLQDFVNGTPEMVIDFTRYDLQAVEPTELTRKWSLMGKINQKQSRPQDIPILPAHLDEEDKKIIMKRYPQLENILWR